MRKKIKVDLYPDTVILTLQKLLPALINYPGVAPENPIYPNRAMAYKMFWGFDPEPCELMELACYIVPTSYEISYPQINQELHLLGFKIGITKPFKDESPAFWHMVNTCRILFSPKSNNIEFQGTNITLWDNSVIEAPFTLQQVGFRVSEDTSPALTPFINEKDGCKIYGIEMNALLITQFSASNHFHN